MTRFEDCKEYAFKNDTQSNLRDQLITKIGREVDQRVARCTAAILSVNGSLSVYVTCAWYQLTEAGGLEDVREGVKL